MKKVEVFLKSYRQGDCYVIIGEGELIHIDELVNKKEQVAIFHAKRYSDQARSNWYTVNLWTGLYITHGKTKQECMVYFEKTMDRYVSIINDPARVEDFMKSHENLETLKTMVRGLTNEDTNN